jgi:arsenate reductase
VSPPRWAAATPVPGSPRIRYEDWPLDEPAGQDLVTIRRIRDDIRARVGGLIASLAVTRM